MKALQRLAGALTSLAALGVLLGLVAGVPVMLVLLFGWPLPRSLPSWSQITMWFQTQGMDQGVLLRILAVVLWVAWAYLVAGMAVQLVATLRGGRARRHRWAAPSQRLSGLLVGLILLGITLMTRPSVAQAPATSLRAALSVPRSTATAPLQPAVAAERHPMSGPHAAAVAGPSLLASSTAPADQMVQVRPGDSLWAIAGREYGDPQDWPRIWQANQGQQEEDGRTFADPGLIQPGWELEVPDVPSTSPATAPPAAPAGEVEVEVQPGDTLWEIAGQEYHDPEQWPRIWEANQGQREDNGEMFTDPHWIDPGWDLKVPAVAAPSMPSSPAPPSPPITSPAATTAPTPAASAPTSPTPTAAGAPTPAASGGAAIPPPPAVQHPVTSSQDWGVTLAEGGTLAPVTAAALAALLLAAQRHQRWRRRPGDPPGSAVALLARRVSTQRIRAAVANWDAGASADEGARPSTSEADLRARLEAVQAVPGRIVVGRRGEDGGDAVVDIDQLHRLVLTGPGAVASARALAVAFLAHHPWEMAQVMAGQGPGSALIPAPEGTPGLQRLSIDSLLSQLEGEITYQRGMLERDHLSDWRQRAGGPDPLPALLALVQAGDLTPPQLERLTAAVEEARGLAIALVVVGALTAVPWGDPVDIDAAGGIDAVSAAVLDGARTLHTLSGVEAAELLTVIACGRGPDIVPDLTAEEEASLNIVPETPLTPPAPAAAGPAPATPSGAALVFPPALEPRRVDIRVFGRLRVLVDGAEVLRALPDAGRQILALLAVRGELTEADGVQALGAGSSDQVWRSRFVRGTRGTRPVLRTALGDLTVDPLPSAGGVFRLNPEVVGSDWARLVAGREVAAQTPDPQQRLALLTRATDGLRGQPFAGADYPWLVEHQEQVRSLAIDTLSDLAHLHADAGDLDAAIQSLDQALSVDPDPIEDLFRQQIMWQYRLGRRETARDLYRRLTRELSQRCDRAPSSETEALMESLGSAPHVLGR